MGTAVTALLDVEDYLKSLKYKFTQPEADALESVKGKLFRIFFFLVLVLLPLLYGQLQEDLGGDIESILPEELVFFRGSLYLGSLLIHSRKRFFAGRLLIKHRYNPRTMQVIEKYFYKEHVYDDSTVDRTIARWRHRNFFGENSAPGQRKHDDVYGADADTEQNEVADSTPSPITALTLRSSVEVSADPFDCLFGYSETLEEKSQPHISPEVPPKDVLAATKKQLGVIGNTILNMSKLNQSDVELQGGNKQCNPKYM